MVVYNSYTAKNQSSSFLLGALGHPLEKKFYQTKVFELQFLKDSPKKTNK